MPVRTSKLVFLCKLVMAAIALVALVAIPVKQLVPGITTGQILLYSAAGVAAVVALVILGAICSLQFSQFILRAGGTDAQWFWFPSEPKGLAALRDSQAHKIDRKPNEESRARREK
jgi:hypothetical protein